MAIFTGRKKQALDNTEYVKTAKSARDMNNFSIHLEQSIGKPLCGSTKALYGKLEYTIEDVKNSFNKQHDGWYWCPDCASKFTGVDAKVIETARRQNYV